MPKKYLQFINSINGRIVPSSEARISIMDNSFLYAEGLFETLLGVDERLIFLRRHLARLKDGARVTGLRLPVSTVRLTEWMVAAARRHPSAYKKVRLTITSGDSARWTGHSGAPRVVISVAGHRLPEEPFRIAVSEFRVDQNSIFRRIKTISYAIQAAAFRKAVSLGYDDALLLNESGHVAEVTSANIFWVKHGVLYTPPLSAGCLDGVTRNAVMVVARRLKMEVVERNEALSNLLRADEIFISSSLKLVIGVGTIGVARRQYNFADGPVTALLKARFRQMVESGDPITH